MVVWWWYHHYWYHTIPPYHTVVVTTSLLLDSGTIQYGASRSRRNGVLQLPYHSLGLPPELCERLIVEGAALY
jgi:hypothetical protein